MITSTLAFLVRCNIWYSEGPMRLSTPFSIVRSHRCHTLRIKGNVSVVILFDKWHNCARPLNKRTYSRLWNTDEMSQFTKQLKTTMSTTPQRFLCRYNPALQLCPCSVTRCYSADRWPASTCSRTLGTKTRTIKLCLHSRRRLAQVWTCLHCHQSLYTAK